MSYKPGQVVHRSFLTPQGFGQLLNPSGGVTTPVVVMRRNGAVDNAVSVSVTHNGLGDWTAACTIPLTYVAGDDVELVITFTFSDIASGLLINLGPLDDFTGIANSLAGTNLIVLSPVGKSSLEIVSGDCYLLADGRQIDFTNTTASNWPTDLTGMTITLNARPTPTNVNTAGNTITLTKVGSIITPTGSSQKVRFELLASDTADLAAGAGNAGWKFSVVATTSSKRDTLVTGLMTVLENVGTP